MHKDCANKRVPFESGQKNVDKEEELQYSSPHRKPMKNESKAKSSLGLLIFTEEVVQTIAPVFCAHP